MQTSILIARLMGPVMLVVGLAVWLNGDGFRAMAREFLKSDALIFLAGILTLSLGVTLVVVHNVWVADWPVIITVIGWVTLIAGILRVAWPQWLRNLAARVVEWRALTAIGGAVYVVLGAVLMYVGFLA
ncbi:MAG TPA: hypothetical protein VK844_01470 [Hyphomicrobiales bacterium]|nr:hypothetical protein [Hyphomicrobiales bacterium]